MSEGEVNSRTEEEKANLKFTKKETAANSARSKTAKLVALARDLRKAALSMGCSKRELRVGDKCEDARRGLQAGRSPLLHLRSLGLV